MLYSMDFQTGSLSPELLVGHVGDDGHGQGWLSPRARLAAVHVPHSLAILLHVARVFSGCGKHPDIRQTYSLHDTYIADLATYKVCQILKPMTDRCFPTPYVSRLACWERCPQRPCLRTPGSRTRRASSLSAAARRTGPDQNLESLP